MFVNTFKNLTYTENDALTHRETGSALLDFYYHAAARRGQDNTSLFASAVQEDSTLAVLALFNLRDIRGGKGERQSFRDCVKWLLENRPDLFEAVFKLVPEYGRWDDLVEFVDHPRVFDFISEQIEDDLRSLKNGDGSISLLAKWLPSVNAGKKSSVVGKRLASLLGLRQTDYRKMLSDLRGYLNVVERDMCARNWSEINYGHVPSRALLIYRKAFKKHDGERYGDFIDAVNRGEKTMKAGTLYPYEIVEKYGDNNPELEALWKSLPDYTGANESALVVADVSGSMAGRPIAVSVSLAIYFAQRNQGAFNGAFITFSARPTFVWLDKDTSLGHAIRVVSNANWDMNTDLQAVFNLVLARAIKYNIPETEMPKAIYIISDMEFDQATRNNSETNFEVIEKKYQAAGYERPVLVFWNVESRNTQTPVTKDERGTVLVSGCSPSVFKAAVQRRSITPYEAMLEVLQSERYLPVLASLQS